MRRERSLSTTDLVECSREVSPSRKLFADKMSLQRERMVLPGSRDKVEIQVPYIKIYDRVFIRVDGYILPHKNVHVVTN
jgi:hypothetical protein